MEEAELKLLKHLKRTILENEPLILDQVEVNKEWIFEVLWFIGLEWETLSPEQTSRYQKIIETLLKRDIISKEQLLVHLDDSVLLHCGLISSIEGFKKRQNIVRTKFTYEQQKYNLLREEPEGFLSLFSSLYCSEKPNCTDFIGEYDLDPNRVLDLLILAYGKNEDLETFNAIKSFKPSLITQVLGFAYTENQCSLELCDVTAKLIKANIFTLEDIWGYLKPQNLQDSFQDYQKLVQSIRRSLNIVVINADVSQRDKDLASLEQQDYSNQKLALLTELVKHNCWSEAYKIFKRFEGKMVLSSVPGAIQVLCDFLEWVMDPVLQDLAKPNTEEIRKFPPGSMVQISSPSKLREFLNDFLPILGVYIGYSEQTYGKVCRFLQGCEDPEYVLGLMEKILLPAFSFAGNEAVRSLWFAIKDFSYVKRFGLYDKWLHYSEGLVAVRQSLTIKDTRAWIRRLSKENIEKSRDDVYKFIHKGSCAFMKEIVSQVVSYPNLIPLCIDAFYTTFHFYHDLVPYSILQYLSTCRKETIDLNNAGISLWLQNISVFTGEFFRSYYKTELTAILNYISDCLSYGQVAQIYILKQILSKMSGWNPPENLTEKMLKSLAGGPKLKIAAYKLGEDRSKTAKSSASLCNALQEKWPGSSLNYFLKLAILASQQASALLYSQSCNFKILALLYDNLISSIILIVDILFLQLKQAKTYSELLPQSPIVVLSKIYNLPLPIIMYIVRPGIDISNIENVIEQLKVVEPDCKIPIQFFAIFWALSLSDIKSAETQYNQEISALNDGSSKVGGKNQVLVENLTGELSFLKRKQDFFADVIRKYSQIPKACEICTELVQKGIYPRLLCSPGDALYCACFVETIVKLQISDFPIFELIEKCIELILPCINCCTEGEASNIGFFFLELLSILSNWKHSIETESKFPYFKDQTLKTFTTYFTTFHNMILKILISGLQSSYIVQKNCLNIINRIFAEFPSNKDCANEISACIAPLKDSNHEDLKLIAQRIYDNVRVKFVGSPKPVARAEIPSKRPREEENGHKKSNSREVRNDKNYRKGDNRRDNYNDKKGYRHSKNPY